MSGWTKIELVRALALSIFFMFGIPFMVLGQHPIVSIVIDGDRIVLSDGQKIALAGIDAPEKHPSEKLSRDAMLSGKSEDLVIYQGMQAADYLLQIAGAMPVVITPAGRARAGGYTPALVYVTNREGHPIYQLNQKMIVEGYAVAAYLESEELVPDFHQLEQLARQSNKGLWSGQGIWVSPQPALTRDSDAATFSGNCMRDSACVWVSVGDDLSGPGMWQSRPGRKCACAKDR